MIEMLGGGIFSGFSTVMKLSRETYFILNCILIGLFFFSSFSIVIQRYMVITEPSRDDISEAWNSPKY